MKIHPKWLLVSLLFAVAAAASLAGQPSTIVEIRPRATLKGHTKSVVSVAFHPGGKILASASGDETIRLWDVAGGKNIAILKGDGGAVTSIAFSPDGKTLASANGYNTIKLWDVASGKNTTTLRGHKDMVGSVAFSPDGKILASGGGVEEDGNVRMWGGNVRLWDVASGKNTRTLYHDDLGAIRDVAFHPDGKILASVAAGTIKLWDVATGKNTTTFEVVPGIFSKIESVSFSPDGKTLAVGLRDDFVMLRLWGRPKGPLIELWDIGTEKKKAAFIVQDNPAVWSVAFSPDGKLLASGCLDLTVKLWEVASGKNIATFTGHSWEVLCVSFSPDGKTLASGGGREDKTIKLWDIPAAKKAQK